MMGKVSGDTTLAPPLSQRGRLFTGALFLIVAGLAAVVARYTFARRGIAVPVLVLPRSALDLGSGKAGEIRDGVFHVENRGAAPLAVSFSPSCGCSELRPRVASIAPNEVLDVRVGIRLSEEPAEKIVTIAVSSNDPMHPQSSFQVRAKCRPPLEVHPVAVEFGHILNGRAASSEIKVTNGDGGPLPVDARVQAVSDSPHVAASATVPNGSGEAVVRIDLSPTAPIGALRCNVAITLEPAGLRVSIPVSSNIRGEYSVAPSVLEWPAGARAREVYFHVWRSDGKPIPPLDRVEAPTGARVEATANGSKRRRYRVAAHDGTPIGPIKLWFAGAKDPAVVRLLPTASTNSTNNPSQPVYH